MIREYLRWMDDGIGIPGSEKSKSDSEAAQTLNDRSINQLRFDNLGRRHTKLQNSRTPGPATALVMTGGG